MRFAWMVIVAAGVVGAPPVAANAALAQSSGAVRQAMDGETLYRTYCAACHGIDGQGSGPAAPALKTAPSNLTSIAARNGGTFPRDRLIQYIVNGKPPITAHGSADMPVWGPNLTALASSPAQSVNKRVEAIVAYIRTLQKGR